MATKTFDQLISEANKIKTNELPGSNTNNLVGGHLLSIIEKLKELFNSFNDEDKSSAVSSFKGIIDSINTFADYSDNSNGEIFFVVSKNTFFLKKNNTYFEKWDGLNPSSNYKISIEGLGGLIGTLKCRGDKLFLNEEVSKLYYFVDDQLTLVSQASSGGGSVDIIDNLSSTRTDAAMSANMGRVLKETTLEKPAGGSVGQVLKKTATGSEWGYVGSEDYFEDVPISKFKGVVADADLDEREYIDTGILATDVYFITSVKQFALKVGTSYYESWIGDDPSTNYNASSTSGMLGLTKCRGDKLFLNEADSELYYFVNDELTLVSDTSSNGSSNSDNFLDGGEVDSVYGGISNYDCGEI